jgi:hypothetical protein
MNDLPATGPTGPTPVTPNPMGGDPRAAVAYQHARSADDDVVRKRTSGSPGLGSAVGFFLALMVLFVLAAAVAQFAVRGDRSVTDAPPAPPVTQQQTPAQTSPPADGNPAGATSPEAVTP